MCVCVCVCMCMRVCMHECVCDHICVSACVFVCLNVWEGRRGLRIKLNNYNVMRHNYCLLLFLCGTVYGSRTCSEQRNKNNLQNTESIGVPYSFPLQMIQVNQAKSFLVSAFNISYASINISTLSYIQNMCREIKSVCSNLGKLSAHTHTHTHTCMCTK